MKKPFKKISTENWTTSSIIEHRERLNAATSLAKPANVPHRDILIRIKNNVKIPVRIYRPEKIEPPYATMFYIPGTAFIAREMVFTEVICTHLAEQSSCQVILINHRLAPEDQFPTGLIDAYNLLKFIVAAPSSLFQIDSTKIAIMGYSSGGNFAASIAIRAKEEGLPIARQILLSPMVDLSRSLKDFKSDFEDQDTAISEAFVEWFLDLYLPDGISPKYPWLSPFWQQPSRLKGLPPTDIVFAEFDRFRSDAEAFYRKLTQSGVDLRTWMIEGENHSYLWYKIEIVKTLGFRIKQAFNLQKIPATIFTASEHHLLFIKPRLNPSEEKKQKENSQLHQMIQSKL